MNEIPVANNGKTKEVQIQLVNSGLNDGLLAVNYASSYNENEMIGIKAMNIEEAERITKGGPNAMAIPDPDPMPLPKSQANSIPWPETNEVIRYYHQDHLGSTRVITDESRNIIKRFNYYPFGEEIIADTSKKDQYKFTGKQRDQESGLDYFGARYYSSKLYRWTQVDPIKFKANRITNPQRWNIYVYCLNNPINAFDPDGKDARKINVKISGTPIGTATTFSYPYSDNKLYKIPTYKLTVSGTNDKGEAYSRDFEVIRFGIYKSSPNAESKVVGKAAQQTHTVKAWYGSYQLHSTDNGDNGAWIVEGNYLIHDGPDNKTELMASIGCIEVCGENGFKEFNETIIALSGVNEGSTEDTLRKIGELGLIDVTYEEAQYPKKEELPSFEDPAQN